AVRIEIENLGASTDFFLTPLWVGLHDGSFDLFSVGTAVTPGLESVAETGSPAILMTEFAGPNRLQSVAADPAGFGSLPGQPPVIDPGNTAVTEIAVSNPAAYRYFSFASMVIPSNDAFVGNGNPTAHELFDALGNFNGTQVIDLTAASIYDAGTEDNTGLGAAFSTLGGVETDTIGGTASQGPDLTNFIGTVTAAGTTIGAVPGSSPFARITISLVPEPASAALVGLGAWGMLGMIGRRRRA
ncbi:MAG: spondin domain-containing protein, partial [Planctomycetales bacterium]|nr:spondin domain-containing protein [Planctomycetales bacterium]